MHGLTLAPRASLLVLAGFILAGCGGSMDAVNHQYCGEHRKQQGLVVILPGIEGISAANLNIRDGLIDAGVDRAVMIYPWGRPIPGVSVLANQVDVIGNRIAGSLIARMVATYQDQYPGRPVHIIGHSGGGGVAVFAAESMPEGRSIEGLVLLSASISRDYDLTKAMSHCSEGIVNFYNPQDTALLEAGTTVFGTVDGVHGPSAGLRGFTNSHPGLVQRRISSSGGDPHFAATREWFVEQHIAPYVRSRLAAETHP